MTKDNKSAGDTSQELKRLEAQLDELISTCERLNAENQSLLANQESLTTERAGLIEKTELARSRVEAMIARLRSMEHSS